MAYSAKYHVLIKVLRQEKGYGALDYEIWGKLQEHVYRSRIRNVDQLTLRISKSGNISTGTRCSSMKWSSSGVRVFELVFEHMEDILNTDFSYVWCFHTRTHWPSRLRVAVVDTLCFGVISLNTS